MRGTLGNASALQLDFVGQFFFALHCFGFFQSLIPRSRRLPGPMRRGLSMIAFHFTRRNPRIWPTCRTILFFSERTLLVRSVMPLTAGPFNKPCSCHPTPHLTSEASLPPEPQKPHKPPRAKAASHSPHTPTAHSTGSPPIPLPPTASCSPDQSP